MTDPATTSPDPDRLQALRARIDRIDETLHQALIERSAIIDELIEAKGSRASAGAIFRPGREADMMRRLAERHAGSLDITVIEHVWRVIITSHTALQAPFTVFVDVSGDPLPSWDAARFAAGFAVPVEPCGSPEIVVDAIADTVTEGGSALGFVPRAAQSNWWLHLGEHVRVMARTPGIEREGRGAAAPHWVLAPPLSDPVPFDVPLTRFVMPKGTEIGDDTVLGVAEGVGGGDAWLVEGTPSEALLGVALDRADCGGYHHPVTTTAS